MGHQLSPSQKELYRRVDEVLHYIWDPIGVSGIPQARDEYHSYLPLVFKRALEAKGNEDIVSYLLMVESESMGLSITEKARGRAVEAADVIIDYRDWIAEKEAEPGGPANPLQH
jgi:hypothetical protein